jgi:hypothetical protein
MGNTEIGARRGRGTALAGALVIAATLGLAGAAHGAPDHKPDLADAVAGTYAGDVISDSKGSSKSGVTLTVTRAGPNTVKVTSDYPRLPVVGVQLTAAMSNILQKDGDTVFNYDRKTGQLDVSFHNDVSWSGSRR